MNIESRSESLSSFIIRFSLFSVAILSSSFNLGLSLKTIGNFLADLSQVNIEEIYRPVGPVGTK
jgi:hypothetical protein